MDYRVKFWPKIVFQKLTAVFAREFRSNATKYSHLRHFFVVVPALSLSQVEHTMACRARVQSVGRRAPPVGEVDSEELAFVEDGFGMGKWESYLK